MSPSAGGWTRRRDSISVLCLQVTWTLGWSSLCRDMRVFIILSICEMEQQGRGVIFVNNHSMEHFNKTDFSTEMVLNLLFASLFLMFCSLVNLLLAKIIARGHNKVAESIPKDEKA